MNSKTLLYILKRLILALITVWVIITITFFVTRLVPGGPFQSEKAITPEAQAALEAKYGLDKPVFEQYLTYLKDIVTKFDFGPSLKQRGLQIIDIIGENPITDEIDKYIHFFNEERPAYSLCYLTPKQYKELRFSSV